MYTSQSCVIERNNHGHVVVASAGDDSRISLCRAQEVGKVTEKKIGWDTTGKSMSYAIDTLSRGLEDGRCAQHSPETYEELCTFVHGERGKREVAGKARRPGDGAVPGERGGQGSRLGVGIVQAGLGWKKF
jgi:hypothetical protein